jgi:hypothetical protein
MPVDDVRKGHALVARATMQRGTGSCTAESAAVGTREHDPDACR